MTRSASKEDKDEAMTVKTMPVKTVPITTTTTKTSTTPTTPTNSTTPAKTVKPDDDSKPPVVSFPVFYNCLSLSHLAASRGLAVRQIVESWQEARTRRLRSGECHHCDALELALQVYQIEHTKDKDANGNPLRAALKVESNVSGGEQGSSIKLEVRISRDACV